MGFRKTLGFEPLTVTATGTKTLQTKYHFGQQIKNQRYKKVTMKKIFRIFEKKKKNFNFLIFFFLNGK